MKQNPIFRSLITLALLLGVVWSCKKEETAVVPTPAVKSAAKDITKFSFAALSPAVDGTIDATAKTISATVLVNTDVTKLTPTLTISDKATVSPASGTVQNFTNPVNYVVTAEDGTTQTYAVSAVINPPKINTFAPSDGIMGTLVVINGEGFSSVSTDIKVTVNGKAANITASNPQQITIQVPEKAGTGIISVDVKGKQTKSAGAFTYKYQIGTNTELVKGPYSFQSTAVDPDDGTVYASMRNVSGVYIISPSGALKYVELRDELNTKHAALTGISILKTGVGGVSDKVLVVTNETKGVYYYALGNFTSTTTNLVGLLFQANDAIYKNPTSIVGVSESPTTNSFLNGTYYMACFGNSSIVRSNRKNGVVSSPSIVGAGTGFNTGTVSSTNAKFNGVVGIFLKNNLIYAADEGNHSIRTIDFDNGKVTTILGTGAAGNVDGTFASVKLNLPSNVVVDNDGLIYVTDRGNNSLRVFDPRSQTSQTLLTGLNAPYGLSIDKNGTLYLGEWSSGSNRVLKLTVK